MLYELMSRRVAAVVKAGIPSISCVFFLLTASVFLMDTVCSETMWAAAIPARLNPHGTIYCYTLGEVPISTTH